MGALATTSTLNSDARIEYSMSGPHEGPLHGIPSYWSWGSHPEVDNPTDSNGYSATTAWGQVYADANAPEPAQGSVRVELKNMQLYVWSKSGQQWLEPQGTVQVGGAHYVENFADNSSIGVDWRTEPDGGISASMVGGYNLHFWPSTGRGTVNASDVGAVYVTYQARLIGPDAASAKYLANAGADWWLNTSASWPDNAQVGEGRFMYLSTAWQAFDFYTGGAYGPAPLPPRWDAFGLEASHPPIDAMGRP